MKVPQIIMLSLLGIVLLVSANMHGKPKGDWDFKYSLLSVCIWLSILYWGGFFNN